MVGKPDTGRAKTSAAPLSVSAGDVTFDLQPPAPFTIEERTGSYRLFLPFSAAAIEMHLEEAGPNRRRLRGGSAAFVIPGSKLGLGFVEPLEFLLLTIEPVFVAQVAAMTSRSWQPRTLIDLEDPAIATLAHEVRRAMLADPVTTADYLVMLARALLCRIGCHLLDDVGGGKGREALSPGMLAQIVRYIDAHLADPISITELADRARLSRSHFSRAFHRMTGDPPQRFILKRRVCRARDLISSGETPLAEVAVRSGFSSQAHLSTAFRSEVGTSPARYRAAFGREADLSVQDVHTSSSGDMA